MSIDALYGNEKRVSERAVDVEALLTLESKDLFVKHWRRPGLHEQILNPEHHINIVFFLAGGHVTRKPDFDKLLSTGGAGQTSIVPAGKRAAWHCDGAMRYLQVSLPEHVCGETASFKPVWFIEDPNLHRLGLVLADLLIENDLHAAQEQQAWANLIANYIYRRYRAETVADTQHIIAGNYDHIVRRAVQIIDAHLDNTLTVTFLAEQLSLSRERLTRAFKCATGRPPYQFIIERRLLRARELLTTTMQPLADVAYRAGFSSQSHMTSTFQRVLGMTPQECRDLAVSAI